MGNKREHAVLIFNPVAGSGDPEQTLAEIEELLSRQFSLEVIETTPEKNGSSLAKSALDRSPDMILACGGDGTITEVANALIGTDVPLGIIPTGTANALSAAILGEHLRLDPIAKSCSAILGKGTRKIDTVRFSRGNMLLLAGVGVEAGMVERADRELKKKFGPFAYLMGGWQQIQEQQEFCVNLVCDGVSHEIQTGSLVIANAAPRTSLFALGRGQPEPDDGLLDITAVVGVNSPWEAVQAMANLFHAGLTETPAGENILHFQAKTVRISCAPEQKLVVDGEILGSTPEEFQVNPGSLTVFAI